MPAYPPPAWLGNTTSWGGSVLRAPGAAAAGEYHMYLAEMAGGCGMETWTTNSIIRHAVSSSGPAGPYQPREVIMQPFAHNPTAIRAPDGTYLIYHIGCGTPVGSRCADCAGGLTSPSCHAPGEEVACNGNTTNILYSKSPDGPWQQLNAPIVKSATMGTPYQIDNPTVTFFPNGSLLLLGRGGDPAREAGSDGWVTAPSWRGPYKMHTMVGCPKSGAGGCGPASPDVEDPFVWRDKRGNLHALFHKFTDEHPNCGGHAYSSDGKDWTLHNTPAYTTTITTADGVGHPFARRERPHLLFGDDGVTPQMLFTSLTNWSVGHKPPNDKAFTFAQAIKQ